MFRVFFFKETQPNKNGGRSNANQRVNKGITQIGPTCYGQKISATELTARPKSRDVGRRLTTALWRVGASGWGSGVFSFFFSPPVLAFGSALPTPGMHPATPSTAHTSSGESPRKAPRDVNGRATHAAAPLTNQYQVSHFLRSNAHAPPIEPTQTATPISPPFYPDFDRQPARWRCRTRSHFAKWTDCSMSRKNTPIRQFALQMALLY